MKIKLKLGVSEQKKEIEITNDELGYTEEDWEDLDEQKKQDILTIFVDNIHDQPYWYLESFKTL